MIMIMIIMFHARAPATGNARSPSEDRRVAGTTTSVLEAERSQVARYQKTSRLSCDNMDLTGEPSLKLAVLVYRCLQCLTPRYLCL